MATAEVNARRRADGVIWHPCIGCGLDWPFPRGHDGREDGSFLREFLCHVCAVAKYSPLQAERDALRTQNWGLMADASHVKVAMNAERKAIARAEAAEAQLTALKQGGRIEETKTPTD